MSEANENGHPADFNVSSYAEELQRAARQLARGDPGRWREVVDRGLAEAYRQQDAIGLASLVHLIASFLDADGRLEEAVAEIRQALVLAGNDQAAVAMLEAARGCFLAATGDVAAAQEAVARAERAHAATGLPLALSRSKLHCAVVRLMTLAIDKTDELDRLLAMDPSEATDSDMLVAMSYYVPFLLARGERAAAHAWIRGFGAAAEAAQHEYRISDALTFERAEAAISGPLDLPSLEGMPRWNWLGRWRLQALRLRASLLRRDFQVVEEELAGLMRARRRAGSAKLDEIDGFEANVRANRDGELAPLTVPLPRSVHLLNIASILAGAEAVAIAGTQAEAARWLGWMGQELPPHIQTAIEWPVSRARAQGLVALRAGDLRAARHWLEDAIRWTERAAYPLERALAQVQLAELLHDRGSPRQEAVRNAVRGEGWSALRAFGIDPAVHAYVVARASSGEPTTSLDPGLTPREAEVLGLLAEGLTYKAIAARMGVAWPTVQVLVHRCYEKLGVSGRWAAVQYARELGIL